MNVSVSYSRCGYPQDAGGGQSCVLGTVWVPEGFTAMSQDRQMTQTDRLDPRVVLQSFSKAGWIVLVCIARVVPSRGTHFSVLEI